MRKVLVLCVALASCGRSADVASGLRVQLVASGWRPAAAGGRNKLVPSASIHVMNVSDTTLPSVQVNAVFHRVGEDGEWGSAFAAAAGSSGLTPGGGATLVLDSARGYTGDDPQELMLHNRQFVDVTVDVFAKYGSRQWTRVAAFPIDRHLLK
ncbi:MAG TPA: hypothetical protein VFB07_00890 [Vicinamibacterales bacterium]|nr:hypothetical protein [Vicinamibacterales bacterium]